MPYTDLYKSANGHLLAFVAGTDQAKEMVMDNQVPQTSTIKRKDVSLKVPYDGDPKFEKIKGTEMAYAVNTSYAVLKIEKKFYCCHEAICIFPTNRPAPGRLPSRCRMMFRISRRITPIIMSNMSISMIPHRM